MKILRPTLHLFFISLAIDISCQDANFYLHFLGKSFHNPAAGGLSDKRVFTAIYQNNNDRFYGFRNVFGSYEQPLPRLRSGFGANLSSLSTHSYEQGEIGLFYNYQFKLPFDFRLRLGVQPGIKRQQFHFDEFYFGPTFFGGVLPNIPKVEEFSYSFNLNWGALLSWKTIDFGIGWRNLAETGVEPVTVSNDAENYHKLYLHVNARLSILQELKAQLSVIWRDVDGGNAESYFSSLSSVFVYKNRFSAGLARNSWGYSYSRVDGWATGWAIISGIQFTHLKLTGVYSLQKNYDTYLQFRTIETALQFEF